MQLSKFHKKNPVCNNESQMFKFGQIFFKGTKFWFELINRSINSTVTVRCHWKVEVKFLDIFLDFYNRLSWFLTSLEYFLKFEHFFKAFWS